MSSTKSPGNQVRRFRQARGWSQAELAQRTGISRTAVSALEARRMSPSVTAALSLAQALDCTVEELFAPAAHDDSGPAWAWPVDHQPHRYWKATVGSRTWLYPVETTLAGAIAHDGVIHNGNCREHLSWPAEKTLVMAGCDPAAGMLAGEFARRSGCRLIALPRSSREALALLGKGVVHIAGLHLSQAKDNGNAAAVIDQLGSGYRLLHLAKWQAGLAMSPGIGARSVAGILRAKLTWVGREAGSGARQCLDEILRDSRPPRRLARDHRGVAEAVRCGWADVGVCVRLASDEAKLKFKSLRWESYDLCYPSELENDVRIQSLLTLIRGSSFRRLVSDLPGYDGASAGDCQLV